MYSFKKGKFTRKKYEITALKQVNLLEKINNFTT